MAMFATFFFRQYRPENYLLLYSGTKKRLSRLENQEVEKVEKLTFFQRGWPMVLVQKWPFFQLCFFRQYRPGKYLSRYSRTKKTPFWAIKTKSLKSLKIDIFPKGLTHAFGPKMAIFTTYFLRQYRKGKCLLRYSRRKKRLSRL